MTEIIGDLRQKHIEELELQLGTLPAFRTVGGVKLSRYYGAFARAAVAAGWFGGFGELEEVTVKKGDKTTTEKRYLLNGEEVGDMKAADVRKIGEAVEKAYNDATAIDPN